jgi:hypothetical protein
VDKEMLGGEDNRAGIFYRLDKTKDSQAYFVTISSMKSMQAAFAVGGLVLVGSCFAQKQQTEKSLPYATVDHPEFIPGAEAHFMGGADRLIGVMDGKVAKAYAASILSQHGVVQDRLAAGPIAVTW